MTLAIVYCHFLQHYLHRLQFFFVLFQKVCYITEQGSNSFIGMQRATDGQLYNNKVMVRTSNKVHRQEEV